MYNFADKEIAKLGLRRKFIRHELFGEYRFPEKDAEYPQKALGAKFKLTVKQCDMVTEIVCDANEKLLNAMGKHGLAVPSECHSGICECVVFLHQDLDERIDHDYLIAEYKTIKDIIAGSSKLKYVFSGHYHAGAECVSDSVRYITLASMTECSENKFFVFDI